MRIFGGILVIALAVVVCDAQAQSFAAPRVAARSHHSPPAAELTAGCPSGNCGHGAGGGSSLEQFPGRCCPDASYNSCCAGLWANYCAEKKPCWTPHSRVLPGGTLGMGHGCQALNHPNLTTPCYLGPRSHGHDCTGPACEGEGCAVSPETAAVSSYAPMPSGGTVPLQPPAIDLDSTPTPPDPAELPDVPKSDNLLNPPPQPAVDGQSLNSNRLLFEKAPSARSVGFPFSRKPTASRVESGFPFSNR